MNSYKKLAKQRDEAIYQVKKAMESRKIHAKTAEIQEKEGKDKKAIAELENIKNSITLNELLDAMAKIYEIE